MFESEAAGAFWSVKGHSHAALDGRSSLVTQPLRTSEDFASQSNFLPAPAMHSRQNLETFGMVIAIGCAVVTTGLLLRRETQGLPAPLTRSVDGQTTPIDPGTWQALTNGGRRVGPASAIFTIVEFADIECPACRRFHQSALVPLMRQFPNEVALVFYHWPLSYHRFAYLGARLAECGAAQGRFPEMLATLYQFQDSLGRAPSALYGSAAGVPDEELFRECASGSDSLDVVRRGSELAVGVGATGTPGLVINGRLLNYVPDSAGLAKLHQTARGKQ